MRYEYITIPFDIGDLSDLNRYSMNGWRVVCVVSDPTNKPGEFPRHFALLERPLPGGYNFKPI